MTFLVIDFSDAFSNIPLLPAERCFYVVFSGVGGTVCFVWLWGLAMARSSGEEQQLWQAGLPSLLSTRPRLASKSSWTTPLSPSKQIQHERRS